MKTQYLALSVASLLISSTAFAEETTVETKSYAYQPIIADAAAVTLTSAGVVAAVSSMKLSDLCGLFDERDERGDCPQKPRSDFTASAALLVSGALTYAFASPTIHAAHGHWDKAGLSFGMRMAPVLAGAALMARGEGDLPMVGLGVLVTGVVAAMVVDAAVLAREPVKTAAATGFVVAPTIDAKNGGAGITASATF